MSTSPGAHPYPEWSDALAGRFSEALYDVGIIGDWWTDPILLNPENDAYRRQLVADLEDKERTFGPPTVRDMDRRLQYEAQRDPGIPRWLRRPWYVPKDQMLAAEAILVEAAGFGYSASGMSFVGETYLRRGGDAPALDLTVSPVPGRIPPGRDVREKEEARIVARMTEAGIAAPRIRLWCDMEPDKAFHGMLSGRTIRLGHMALGIPYIINYGTDGEP